LSGGGGGHKRNQKKSPAYGTKETTQTRSIVQLPQHHTEGGANKKKPTEDRKGESQFNEEMVITEKITKKRIK